VQGNVSATTSGSLDNDSGVIQAAGDVSLANGGLSNSAGAVKEAQRTGRGSGPAK
jgi:adhesin HecA-like repeat protein